MSLLCDGPFLRMRKAGQKMEISLRSARVNKGYTQKEAAGRIGISEETLSRYERGRTYPSVEVIKRMEEVYGISYNEIRFTAPKPNG